MTRRQWLKGMVLMSFSFAAGNEHPERWVIIVSIDGGKSSAIKRLLAEGKLPNLKRLMDDGSYTLTAQTVIPSNTAPGHVSMLTGIDYPKRFPDDEAIVKKNEPFDERRHRPVSVVTVFEIVKQAGLRTALLAGAGKRVKYVEKPGTLDVAEYLPSDDERLRRAIALLGDERKRPHLLFLHLTETDRNRPCRSQTRLGRRRKRHPAIARVFACAPKHRPTHRSIGGGIGAAKPLGSNFAAHHRRSRRH
jgi:hypothetical protein